MPGGCTANGTLNEANFSKPLPVIGLYVAAATFCCAAAMAVDTFLGFLSRRLWFPSKYFTLNAATLTILAVATKLPVDLNTSMPRAVDQLSKLSGTVLICTVMGNLMPSVGVIDNPVSNIVALVILVVTVIVNVGIQMDTGVIYVHLPEHFVIVFFMLVLLILLISSALPISTTKQQLEELYNTKHKHLEGDVDFQGPDRYDEEKLKHCVEKYWLMAYTSNPQYVLGRSVTCTASGAFCLLSALVLVEAFVRSFVPVPGRSRLCKGTSDYGWSIFVVLLSQAAAIFVGTIAPAFRWFTAVNYRRPDVGRRRWTDEFGVEKYWIQKLTELKEIHLISFRFKNWRCQKISHSSKNLMLSFLIKVQTGVVLTSKIVRLVSILPVCWLNHGRKLFRKLDQKSTKVDPGSSDLENFVLRLEGEDALVKLITKHERSDTERWIQRGEKKSPTNLIALIRDRSRQDFIWVGRFDGDELVPQLAPVKIEHCWALPVVTLASIAVGIAGVDQSSLLLRGVGEGLRYVGQIEKHLEAKGLVNQRKAADIIWCRLELENCWFHVDLGKLFDQHPGRPLEVVEKLRDAGKKCVEEFLEEWHGEGGSDVTVRPLLWPPKVLAAHCMYRLTSTILTHRKTTDPKYLEEHLACCWLRAAVSDLLGACLTNLPIAIYHECFCNPIEVREESVRGAALLLGEAKAIMSTLKDAADQTATSDYPEDTTYVDDWREKMGTDGGSGWSLHEEMCCSPSSGTMSSSTHLITTTDEPVTSAELTQQEDDIV